MVQSTLPPTGTDAHRYAVEHDWLKLPPGYTWGDTHGLAQDRRGRIYVAHTVGADSQRADAVAVFDADGNFLQAFGAAYRGGAHGLALREEAGVEYLYLTDVTRHVVAKLALDGTVLWERTCPREAAFYKDAAKPFSPTNVAFLPDGGLLVADGYGSNVLLRYDRDGNFGGLFGHAGGGESAFSCPHGLIVDTRGAEPVLVIADRGNFRLQVWSLDGRFLRAVRDDAALKWPCHFDARGDLLVCPDLEGQVCLLDREYRVVAQLGDGRSRNGAIGSRRTEAREEFTPGEFIAPHAAIFLGHGDILVAEWLPIGRLTRLRRLG